MLPDDQGIFASTEFMDLERVIIRSAHMDVRTNVIELAAAYTGTMTLIEDILTVSNVRVGLSFVSMRAQKFTFDIRGTFSVGNAPIDMRLIRNEEGNFTVDLKQLKKSRVSQLGRQAFYHNTLHMFLRDQHAEKIVCSLLISIKDRLKIDRNEIY